MIKPGNWENFEEILIKEKSDWKKRDEILKLLLTGLNKGDSLVNEFISKNSKGLSN